jgi:hypothetical protein
MKSSSRSAPPARPGVESLECRALLSATHLLVEAPHQATVGDTIPVTVTALDASSQVVTDYAGTVQLTSSDDQAVLPGSHTFTAADQGKYTFSVRLQTAGTPLVLAMATGDSRLLGSASVTLVPNAAVAHFAVGVASSSNAGGALTVTVTAQDAQGNTVTNYHGTAHFATTDGKATVPADHTFTDADKGAFTTSLTLDTAGPQTITVTDGSLHGSGTVTVAPGAAMHFDVTGSPTVAAGGVEAVTVVARDAFGNVATGYRGTAMLTVKTQGGPGTIDPIPHVFTAADAGTAMLDVTLPTRGPTTITVTDPGPPVITGGLVVTVGGMTANESYVDSLYQDLLGRPADPASLAAWSGLLGAGTDRGTVVHGIEASAEYRADAITALYQNLLGRMPDQAGLASFVAQMGGGLSLDGVAQAIMSSDEYYQVRGGGTPDGFVQAVYQDNLLRGPDANGESYFDGLLAQGDARSDVIHQVMVSPEAEQLVVRAAYNQFLHRDADAAGLSSFVALRQQGMTTDGLFATLLASDEYFHNASA